MAHTITDKELEFLKESALIEGYDFDKKPLTREVKAVKSNGEKAFIFMMDKLKETDGVLYEADLLQCHKLLMDGLLPDAGSYRSIQVYVGNHVPPKAEVVPMHMAKFIEEYNEFKFDELESHRRFESIHPFRDGNGRIGRILWACDAARRCNEIRPILDNFCYHWYMGDNPRRLDTFKECRYNYYEYLSEDDSRN